MHQAHLGARDLVQSKLMTNDLRHYPDWLTKLNYVKTFIDIVDLVFAGAFYTKCVYKISVPKFSPYICFFTCSTTKAVQVELVSGLSTAWFPGDSQYANLSLEDTFQAR